MKIIVALIASTFFLPFASVHTDTPAPQTIAQYPPETKSRLEVMNLYLEADQLRQQGKYTEAIAIQQKALETSKQTLGLEHEDTALCINNLAGLYQEVGNYSEAEPLFLQALEIRTKLFGADGADTINSMNSLAAFYQAQGRYSEAEPLFFQVLEIRKKVLGLNHPETSLSINNLARLYQDQGNYAAAEPLFLQALEISRKIFGLEHSETATSLNNLARLYQDQGNYTAAEPLFLQALEIKKKVFGLEHPQTALVINNLAGLYQDQGNYAVAEPLFLQALEINKKIFGLEHPNTSSNIINLAGLYYVRGKYNEAELLSLQALEINKKILGLEHPETAISMGNLANLYLIQGKYSEAEPLFLQALEINKKVFGLEHPQIAFSMNNLAGLYRVQGNYSAAEPLFLQALEINKKILGLEHPYTANNLNKLAKSYWSQNNLPSTLAYLQQGLDVEESILARNLVTGSEQQKQLYFGTFINTTNQSISFHFQSTPNNQEAASLALTTILRRKGRILDTLSNSYQTLRQNLTLKDRAIFEELNQARSQLTRLVYKGIGNKTTEQYQKELKQLETRADSLEVNLSNRSAEFKIENQKVTIEAIQKLIPQDTALVEFISYKPYEPKTDKYGQPRYAVYILFLNGITKWVDLGEAEAIDYKIDGFRTEIGIYDSRDIENTKRLARELDAKIMQPVRQLLGNTRKLLISPDSQLNLIPFAALIDENNQYLVETYSINYLTSGRDLLKYQLNPQAKDNPVIVANPDYQVKSDSSNTVIANNGKTDKNITTVQTRSVDLNCCEPLKGTEIEAKAIASLLPNTKLYLGKEATKSVVQSLQVPSILMIASHGFFLSDKVDNTNTETIDRTNKTILSKTENPLLLSGLALTGFNPKQKQYEGVLTALEVSGLNLYGTKLVVLSACGTGLGGVKNGEGVYGLRRALVLSGAESHVITLWNIAESLNNKPVVYPTKDFMVAYYQNLLKKTGRSEALRQVQLQFLKNPDYAHPYFWAAFIPLGNWTPLELEKK